MSNVYIITGQTATGKTKFAYKLAKKLNGELVNFDSRQIYKKLDIITGKERFDDVKTHLIDIIDPKKYYSSYDFCKMAWKALKQVLNKGKTAIFVGGTYLYIKHLLYGVETENIPPDWKLRTKLEKMSVKGLQSRLLSLNPIVINQMNESDKSNSRRLIRKLEIEYFKHEKLHPQPDLESDSRIHENDKRKGKKGDDTVCTSGIFNKNCLSLNIHGKEKKLNIKFIGLKFKNKNSLKNAIKKRVEQRLKDGAIQEVKKILKNGYSSKDPGLQTIGYKQIIQFLDGKLSIEQIVEQWINKELQYAKRQYTFMKKDKNIKWREV